MSNTPMHIPPEHMTRSTADDAKAWEQTPEGRDELRRLAAMRDEGIDFSDIPCRANCPTRRSPGG